MQERWHKDKTLRLQRTFEANLTAITTGGLSLNDTATAIPQINFFSMAAGRGATEENRHKGL